MKKITEIIRLIKNKKRKKRNKKRNKKWKKNEKKWRKKTWNNMIKKEKSKKKMKKSKKNLVISGQKAPTRADIAHFPIAHAHIQGNSEGVKWPSVTFGSHGTCTTVLHCVLLLRKKRGKKTGACAENTSGQGWKYHRSIDKWKGCKLRKR